MSWVQLNCNHFCSWCQTYDIEVQKLQPWSLKCKWSELLNTFVHLSIVCIYICIHILQFSLERSCISFTDVLFLLTGTAECLPNEYMHTIANSWNIFVLCLGNTILVASTICFVCFKENEFPEFIFLTFPCLVTIRKISQRKTNSFQFQST